jgi:hypothetical protein
VVCVRVPRTATSYQGMHISSVGGGDVEMVCGRDIPLSAEPPTTKDLTHRLVHVLHGTRTRTTRKQSTTRPPQKLQDRAVPIFVPTLLWGVGIPASRPLPRVEAIHGVRIVNPLQWPIPNGVFTCKPITKTAQGFKSTAWCASSARLTGDSEQILRCGHRQRLWNGDHLSKAAQTCLMGSLHSQLILPCEGERGLVGFYTNAPGY